MKLLSIRAREISGEIEMIRGGERQSQKPRITPPVRKTVNRYKMLNNNTSKPNLTPTLQLILTQKSEQLSYFIYQTKAIESDINRLQTKTRPSTSGGYENTQPNNIKITSGKRNINDHSQKALKKMDHNFKSHMNSS